MALDLEQPSLEGIVQNLILVQPVQVDGNTNYLVSIIPYSLLQDHLSPQEREWKSLVPYDSDFFDEQYLDLTEADMIWYEMQDTQSPEPESGGVLQRMNNSFKSAVNSDSRLVSYATKAAFAGFGLFALAPYVVAQEPVCGDGNGDLVVSILDSLVAAQAAASLIPLSQQSRESLNVQNPEQGVLNILDALVIAQYAVGLLSSLQCYRDSAFVKRDSPAGDVYFAVWGMNGSEVTPMTVPLPPGIPPVGEGVGAESQSAMLVEGRTSAGVNYTTRFYVGEDIRLIDGPNDLVSPTDVTARLETFDAQLIGPPYDLGKWVAAFENPLVNGGLGQSFAFRGERVTITEVYQDLSETRVRLEGGTDLSFNTASPPSSVEGSIATYRNVQAQITGIAQDKTVISVDGLSTLELAVGDHAVIPGHADAHIKVTGINPVAGTVDVKWEYTNWLLTDRQPGQPGMDQSTVEDLNGIVNTLVTKVNCTPTGELQSLELVLNDMTQRILYGDRPNQKLFTNRESPFFNIDFAGMTGLGGSQVRGVELKTDQSTAPTYSFLILSYTDPITGMQVGDVDGQTSPLPPLRILEKISSTLRKLLIRNQEIPGTYNISPNNLIMTTKADTSGKEYTLAWEYLGVDVGRSVAQFRDKADAGTVYEFPVSPSGDFTLARSTPTGQLSIDGKVQDVMSSVSTIAVDMNGNGVHNPADTGVVYSIFRFPGGYGLKVPPSIQPDGISLTPGDGSHQVYFIIPADKRVRDPSVPSSPLEINFQFSAGGDPDARVPYAIPIIPISGFDESLRQFRPDLNRLVTIYPGMRVVYFEGGLGQTKLNFYPDVFRNVADLKFARRREP